MTNAVAAARFERHLSGVMDDDGTEIPHATQ